jgi:transposase
LNLRKLRLERGRRFGDVWLALKLWQATGLDRVLEQRLPSGREEVSWVKMAAVLVFARLCEPSSELHIAEDWFRSTALGDLLDIDDANVNDDRCYRALDHLLPHQEVMEKHIKERFGELFKVDYDLLLYDITSTYFEGQAGGNDLAKRGHSRDHRPDCKQVCIGLVVTREGYPLGFEVFAGNRHDSTTMQEVVKKMEDRYGKASRVWAMDRGMVSEKTVAWLRERKSRYIVGTPKNQLGQWEQQLLDGDWSQIREGLEVKRCPALKRTATSTNKDPLNHEPSKKDRIKKSTTQESLNDEPAIQDPIPMNREDAEDTEVFILCRSAERSNKELAMRESFAKRIETKLQKIKEQCVRRRCQVGVVERQVGRLLAKNSRASRFFDIQVSADDTGRAMLRWERREAEWQRAAARDGCYVLRSNVNDWSAEELWKAYIQLTQAEAAFRIQKDELRLRPVWHQKAHRVRAHILVCFLSYVLWKTLEGWMKQARLGSSVATVLEEFARIQSTDVVIPTLDDREIRMRCVVNPDPAQKILLEHLGLELPQRLRLPRGVGQM